MTEERFRELLAGYLAGELDEQQTAAFRAELEANEQRRKLADELQAAAAALEANLLADDEARRRTQGLELETPTTISAPSASERATRPARRGHNRLRSVLRYAAVIVLAFGAGFLVRGWQLPSPVTAVVSPKPAPEVNERYVANFAQATQSYPRSSTFTRSLLMLARK